MKRIPYLTFEVQGQIHDENLIRLSIGQDQQSTMNICFHQTIRRGRNKCVWWLGTTSKATTQPKCISNNFANMTAWLNDPSGRFEVVICEEHGKQPYERQIFCQRTVGLGCSRLITIPTCVFSHKMYKSIYIYVIERNTPEVDYVMNTHVRIMYHIWNVSRLVENLKY